MRTFLILSLGLIFTNISLIAQDCDSLLNPIDDGSGNPNLVISEINPGDYIDLYNTTFGWPSISNEGRMP